MQMRAEQHLTAGFRELLIQYEDHLRPLWTAQQILFIVIETLQLIVTRLRGIGGGQSPDYRNATVPLDLVSLHLLQS